MGSGSLTLTEGKTLIHRLPGRQQEKQKSGRLQLEGLRRAGRIGFENPSFRPALRSRWLQRTLNCDAHKLAPRSHTGLLKQHL